MPGPTLDASPFAAVLRTNYIPSDNERVQIDNHLQHSRLVVESLDDRLANLQLQIDLIQKEREPYDRYVKKHEELLSPGRTIPEDVLRLIFGFCIAEALPHPLLVEDKELNGDRVHPTAAPLLLTHVCHRWREMVSKMPELWTNPLVTFPRNPEGKRQGDEPPRTKFNLLRLHISRSSNLPISMTIEGSLGGLEGPVSYATKSLRSAVTSGLARCRRLTLLVASPHLIRIITVPHSVAPLLEHVDIRYVGDERERNPFSDEPRGLCNGPSIKGIGFTGNFPAAYIMNLPFERSRLTDLRVSDSGDGCMLLGILADCPRLQRLQFVVKRWVGGTNFNLRPVNNPITLPHLESLAISLSRAGEGFFSKLRLPGVTTLSQSGMFDEYDLMPPTQQYGSTIRHLSLCARSFPTRGLVEIVLSQLKALERLTLSDDVDHTPGDENRKEPHPEFLTSNFTLHMLTPGYRGSHGEHSTIGDLDMEEADNAGNGEEHDRSKLDVVCPALRHLSIMVAWPRSQGISDSAIYQFIYGRRKRLGSTLQSVTIIQQFIQPQWEPGVVEELRREGVNIDGMNIHLQYKKPVPSGDYD